MTVVRSRRPQVRVEDRSLATTACPEGAPHEAAPVAGLTTVLQALADPVRLAIVRAVAGPAAPSCCALGLPVTKSTLSHHLRVLREAGIIEQRCVGTRKVTSVRRAHLDAKYPGLLDSVLGAALREGAVT